MMPASRPPFCEPMQGRHFRPRCSLLDVFFLASPTAHQEPSSKTMWRFKFFSPNSFTVGVLNAVLSVSALAGLLCPPPCSCVSLVSGLVSHLVFQLVWDAVSVVWACLKNFNYVGFVQLFGVYGGVICESAFAPRTFSENHVAFQFFLGEATFATTTFRSWLRRAIHQKMQTNTEVDRPEVRPP